MKFSMFKPSILYFKNEELKQYWRNKNELPRNEQRSPITPIEGTDIKAKTEANVDAKEQGEGR